jgi:hypothetical protein
LERIFCCCFSCIISLWEKCTCYSISDHWGVHIVNWSAWSAYIFVSFKDTSRKCEILQQYGIWEIQSTPRKEELVTFSKPGRMTNFIVLWLCYYRNVANANCKTNSVLAASWTKFTLDQSWSYSCFYLLLLCIPFHFAFPDFFVLAYTYILGWDRNWNTQILIRPVGMGSLKRCGCSLGTTFVPRFFKKCSAPSCAPALKLLKWHKNSVFQFFINFSKSFIPNSTYYNLFDGSCKCLSEKITFDNL